jgi:hypothetical protein
MSPTKICSNSFEREKDSRSTLFNFRILTGNKEVSKNSIWAPGPDPLNENTSNSAVAITIIINNQKI